MVRVHIRRSPSQRFQRHSKRISELQRQVDVLNERVRVKKAIAETHGSAKAEENRLKQEKRRLQGELGGRRAFFGKAKARAKDTRGRFFS